MRRGTREGLRASTILIIVVAVLLVGYVVVSVIVRNPGLGTAYIDPSDASGETPIAQLRVPMSPALKTFYDQSLVWHDCHKHFTCTVVSEPTDWNHPSAGSISVALIKHAATGVSRGALVVDPGGPGGSGVELVEYGVTDAVDAKLAKNYDVIGFDPRGVGSSTPVTCLSDAEQDDYLYAPVPGVVGSDSWIAAQKANARTLAKACRQNTGALLEHIDTVSVAHDLDVVRAALGEKKLNYLGYSWGSYLGTVYAGLYPANIGRFVFDGIDDPWAGEDYYDDGGGSSNDDYDFDSDGAVSQARSFEKSLDSYIKACVQESSVAVGTSRCPLQGTYEQAKKSVETTFATVATTPLANKDGRTLTGATLATATLEPLYSQQDWPELTTMFRQLEKGKATKAFELADEYNERSPDGTYYDNSSTAMQAIQCLEGGSEIDLDFDRAELAELRTVAPILGSYFSYGDLFCSGWTGDAAPFPEQITSVGASPILLVGTTHDPATPYENAKALSEQLSTAHLVTFNGEGHTAYNLGNACVDDVVDKYFIDGTVPESDPQCR